MATAPQLATTVRTEKGKGSARRARAAGQVPAVLYGHGTDPKHLLLPNRDLAAILRNNGVNAVVELDIEGDKQLALTKQVDVHPLRNYIEHVDLLVVKHGEKVIVEVPLVLTGEPAPGTLVTQDLDTIQIEVDALQIPDQFEVSIDGAQAGTQVFSSEVAIPAGAEMVTDPESLIVAVNESPSEASMEAEVDTEGAGVVEDAPETETA